MAPGPFTRVAATVRDVGRARRILAVLLRNGFGDVLGRLPLEGPLALGTRALRRSPTRPIARLPRAVRVRRVLEELGPVYVKLGQLLGGRPDIIPPDWVEELARLHDEVAPMPFEIARAVVEAELGRPLAESFSSFDPVPIAAASMAQVHRAVLADGQPVAVKVQRPDTEATVAADIAILRYLASLAAGRLIPEEVLNPVEVVEELGRMLTRETDFRRELRTLQRFGVNFQSDPTVKIPRAFPALSTDRVLTMELVIGERQTSPEALAASGLDPRQLARVGAHAFLRMLFEHGLFHGDPHAGNVLFCPGGVVAFLDFGAAGRLDADLRGHFLLIS
jgi:ubiquinone biosynthesis protein